MVKEKDNGMLTVAIVGIVAIVAMVLLISNRGVAPSYEGDYDEEFYKEANLLGNAMLAAGFYCPGGMVEGEDGKPFCEQPVEWGGDDDGLKTDDREFKPLFR